MIGRHRDVEPPVAVEIGDGQRGRPLADRDGTRRREAAAGSARKIETKSEDPFATARSGRPSPLKSPARIHTGACPAPRYEAVPKLGEHVPLKLGWTGTEAPSAGSPPAGARASPDATDAAARTLSAADRSVERTSRSKPRRRLLLGVHDRDRGHVDDVGDLDAALEDVHRALQPEQDRPDRLGAGEPPDELVGGVGGLEVREDRARSAAAPSPTGTAPRASPARRRSRPASRRRSRGPAARRGRARRRA